MPQISTIRWCPPVFIPRHTTRALPTIRQRLPNRLVSRSLRHVNKTTLWNNEHRRIPPPYQFRSHQARTSFSSATRGDKGSVCHWLSNPLACLGGARGAAFFPWLRCNRGGLFCLKKALFLLAEGAVQACMDGIESLPHMRSLNSWVGEMTAVKPGRLKSYRLRGDGGTFNIERSTLNVEEGPRGRVRAGGRITGH